MVFNIFFRFLRDILIMNSPENKRFRLVNQSQIILKKISTTLFLVSQSKVLINVYGKSFPFT